ncbi:hypothetical protein EDD18DRAFT_1081750, partial [Armillaria luteobubalina]
KKHVCTLRSKHFKIWDSLKVHVNTHTGATPLGRSFPGCDQGFNVSYNMRRHYRNHTNSPSACLILAPLLLSPSHTLSSSPSPSSLLYNIYQIYIFTIVVDYVL